MKRKSIFPPFWTPYVTYLSFTYPCSLSLPPCAVKTRPLLIRNAPSTNLHPRPHLYGNQKFANVRTQHVCLNKVCWIWGGGVIFEDSCTFSRRVPRIWTCIAISQAVRRRFPDSESRVLSQFNSCGFYDEQSCTGAQFFRVSLLPLSIFTQGS